MERECTCDARRGQWEKVGDVVGGPGEGSGDTVGVGGKWHRGRQWDYVVDVDFADGVAPKKLAFDRHDNPYLVADRCAHPRPAPDCGACLLLRMPATAELTCTWPAVGFSASRQRCGSYAPFWWGLRQGIACHVGQSITTTLL